MVNVHLLQLEGQTLQLVVKLLPLLNAATAHTRLQQEMLMAAMAFADAAKKHRAKNQDADSEVCCALLCCAVQNCGRQF